MNVFFFSFAVIQYHFISAHCITIMLTEKTNTDVLSTFVSSITSKADASLLQLTFFTPRFPLVFGFLTNPPFTKHIMQCHINQGLV